MNQVAAVCCGALSVALLAAPPALRAQVLHNFGVTAGDGVIPSGGVIMDAAGALYGITSLNKDPYSPGLVYKLTPPASGRGQWTEQVLYQFGAPGDGIEPEGNLLMDSSGSLYGTTYSGGSGYGFYGVIYKLTPATDPLASWTETILHDFSVESGYGPSAGLIADASGALYGTTRSGGTPPLGTVSEGTVFKLAPPPPGQTDWTYQVLHVFASGDRGGAPTSRLVLDAKGNLFGVADIVAFEVSPPAPGKTDWTTRTIFDFINYYNGVIPFGGLAIDANGTLYGNTSFGGHSAICYDCGTVFSLASHADGTYEATDLYDFTGPSVAGMHDGEGPTGDVSMDAAGNLYGTTTLGGVIRPGCYAGCGTVYKLNRPSAGQVSWVETHYAATNQSGKYPRSGVLVGADGRIYGTTTSGGLANQGTAFTLPRNALQIWPTATLPVR